MELQIFAKLLYGGVIMHAKFVSLFTATALLIIYGIICAVTDEPAFVFCSVVYTEYVDLVIYIYDLSEQFSPVWPWQR